MYPRGKTLAKFKFRLDVVNVHKICKLMIVLLDVMKELMDIFVFPLSYRSLENMSERPVKKIKLRFQGSPMPNPKQNEPLNTKKGKKLLFNEESNSQSVDMSSQKELATGGTEDLPDRDLTEKEWCMQYMSQKKKVVLYTARKKGNDQLDKETPFMYGRILRFDYEDEDSTNILVMIDCARGVRKVYLSEDLLLKESCGPESFRKDLQSSQNLIVTLRPYIQGHMSPREPSLSPVKVTKKRTKVQSKPAKRKPTKMSDSNSSSESEDDDIKGTPGAELASGILSSEQNNVRRALMQKKLVRKGQVFNLPITHIHRPPIDEKTGRRPLEIREPHRMHVQNLKKKMKINPHATVVPFIVMVDPEECSDTESFDVRKHDQYNYFVIGGSHSAEARRQLVKEHPTTFFFKYAECKIYVGLTTEEAKLLAWDHNNDNDYRQKMSSIERIRFFHHEFLDYKQNSGVKVHPGLRRQCLHEVGIVVDENVKSDGLRKYEPWFQLAFRDGEVWDLQDQIFSMWESKEVKGQRQKKGKVDPTLELKSQAAKKIDLTIEEAADDMKLSLWRAMQGIKEEKILVSVLSRVVAKELSLEEMVTEFNK